MQAAGDQARSFARAQQGLERMVLGMAELVSAAQLAEILAISHKSVKRLAAQQRWYADELPMPVEGLSPRRWSVKEVDAWLLERESAT